MKWKEKKNKPVWFHINIDNSLRFSKEDDDDNDDKYNIEKRHSQVKLVFVFVCSIIPIPIDNAGQTIWK